MDNGEVLTFSRNKVAVTHRVQSGDVYIDSYNFDIDNSIIRERRILSDDGMLAVIFSAKQYKLNKDPNIVSRGFIYVKDSEEFIGDISEKAKQIYNDYYNRTKRFHPNHIMNIINNELTEYIYEKTEKKPMIVPIIMNF